MSAAQRDTFVALVEAHRRLVLKIAHTYCWSEVERADLVQDILAQLWRAFPRYDATRPFSTWMYRIALNVAISWVRSAAGRRRRTEPLDLARHDVPVLGAREHDADAEVRALYAVIERLEPMNRALLLLYLDDQPYREIAAILGITETNVATKIARLKLRLKRDLGEMR